MVVEGNIIIVEQKSETKIPTSLKQLESTGQDLRNELLKAWPNVLQSVMKCCKDSSSDDMPEALDWLERLLKANVPNGKLTRGCATVSFYRELKPTRTAEEDYELYIAGFLVEILQSASLIVDDIMDGSTYRRGETCWYKRKGVGMLAINDGFMLENLVYKTLAFYFGKKEYYGSLVKLLQETTFKTIMGQNMDTRLAQEKHFESFNLQTYRRIVKLKTSYYTFYAPIAFAMIMAGIKDQQIFEALETVLLQIGEYFQIQDDYLDCYGNLKQTGKNSTDIIDGKCTWLFVKALESSTAETRAKLLKSYGQDSINCENEVKEIYQILRIQDLYDIYEFETFRSITKKINNLPDNIPKSSIRQFLNAMHKRNR